MLNVSNEQPNVQSAILPEAGPFALYVQLKVNANTANVLGRVDLCCTFRVQQYIGSHINMNASDNMLA